MEDMDIQETMRSMKGDSILYCAFKDQQTIKEIHLRIAESRNEIMNVRDYIPPQLCEGIWSWAGSANRLKEKTWV